MTTATEEIPVRSCMFRLQGVEVAASPEGDGKVAKRAFYGKANTGEPFPDWRYGRAVLDMASLKVDRQDIAVLKDHYQEIGFTEKLTAGDNGIDVRGVVLGVNDIGRETIAFLDAGMPFQMSVYVPPGNVLRVQEGESVEVNGKLHDGPIAVWQGCSLREVTITALGRDGNTSVALLGGRDRDSVTVPSEEGKMSKKTDDDVGTPAPTPLTAALLKEQQPDIHSAVVDEGKRLGVEAERERIKKIRERGKGIDAELVEKAINDGLTVESAVDSFLSYMQSQKEGRLAANRDEHKDTVGVDEPEPEEQLTEFTEGQPAGKAAKLSFSRLPEGEDKWKQGFERHGDAELEMDAAALREEFGDVELYLAYKRHPDTGAVGAAGRRKKKPAD